MVAQQATAILANIEYDPFVRAQMAETGGSLLTHYPAPLVDKGDVFMLFKTGTFASCSPPGSRRPFPCASDAWDTQKWNLRRLSWQDGELVEGWNFQSDWRPVPDLGGLAGWEPVFHGVLANDSIYIPGGGGSVFRVDRLTGDIIYRTDPFDDLNTYVTGPLSADAQGNVYYHAIKVDSDNPWGVDVKGAWIVRIAPDDTWIRADYAPLVTGAPAADGLCNGVFPSTQGPLPPSADAKPPQVICGAQRPGINVAPAIAPDGTVYSVSRAHFNSRYSFIVAINPDLTPKWTASLRDRLTDGCGTPTLPPNGTPGGCREGSRQGVDPSTNELPAGRVSDLASSSPAVAPDGSVFFGSSTTYNRSRGHLFKFSSTGEYLASYDFGWDTTPAIYPHDDTYSVIMKDNHYPDGPFNITRLSADLKVEWKFLATNTESCRRLEDGTVECVSDHPNGFEWCINAPAVDADGNVFANNEDGRLYVIGPDGKLKSSIFLNLALGAAYTPLAIGDDGLIYTENDGRLFVVGERAPGPM